MQSTILFTPVGGTYNGQGYGARAEVFGVDGVYLGLAAISYSGGSVPVHAGTYTATATF